MPMAWQRQHILFKYLKTHSVGLVWSGLVWSLNPLSHHDLAPLKPEFTWNKQKFTTFLEYPCSTKTLLVSSSSQLSTLNLKWNIPDFSFLEHYWQNSTTSKKKNIIFMLLYNHPWNTKWAFVLNNDIFTCDNNMLSPHVKRSLLLCLHINHHFWWQMNYQTNTL